MKITLKTRRILRWLLAGSLFLLTTLSLTPWQPALAQDPEPPPPQSVDPATLEADLEPLPAWSSPIGTTENPEALVTIDPATGLNIILPPAPPAAESASVSQMMDTFVQLATGEERAFGSLTVVPNPEDWPDRTAVKMWSEYPSGATTVCTGILIDSSVVLTAGHCVYTWEASRCTGGATKCWADKITVAPGWENNHSPYGWVESFAVSGDFIVWNGWINSKDYDYDMALVKLDFPIGALTGWFGYGPNSDSWYIGRLFHSTGYPAAPPYDGSDMYTWQGSYDTIEEFALVHENMGYGGQSGSGTYYWNTATDQYFVQGVHSHTRTYYSPPKDEVGNTRITTSKFTSIYDRIQDHTPDIYDLVPMDINTDSSTYNRGDILGSMNYYVFNHASVSKSKTVSVSVYLSSNDTISIFDTLLSTHQFTWNFPANGGVRVTVSPGDLPRIPYNLVSTDSDEDFWIGVILNVSDSDTSDNAVRDQDAKKLTINHTIFIPFTGK